MFVCLALKHVGLLSVICSTGPKVLPYFAKRTEEKLEISLKIAILIYLKAGKPKIMIEIIEIWTFKSSKQQAMITLQEMAVFNSLYGS